MNQTLADGMRVPVRLKCMLRFKHLHKLINVILDVGPSKQNGCDV